MMIECISSFQKWINNGNIQTHNRFFNKIIKQFKCLLLQKEQDYKNINQNFNNESKIIIIDKINDLNGYYVVIFDFTILFISDTSKLPNIINNFNESTIFSLFDYHNSPFLINFQEKINIYEKKEMISYFSKYIKIKIEGQNKIEIWNHVKACISSFFINKGYLINRNKRFDTKKTENKEGEFIELKLLGATNSSEVTLAFHVETQEIVSIKTFYKNEKLFNREYKLYSKLRGDLYHPLIPHFYGELKDDAKKSLIIEYIEGKTLDKIQFDKISDEDRFYIILQIMIIIEYLQFHGFVYRDLKPNNLIVDRNNNIKLIDFDQTVYLMDDAEKDSQVTKDFSGAYVSPELTTNQENAHNSNKMDVFSIGILIYFIFFNEIGRAHV